MGSVIEAVKAGVGAIVGNPALAGFDVPLQGRQLQGLPRRPYAFQHQLSPTTDTALVSSAVATWVADGGIDTPEGQLFALHRLATDPAIGWRPDARRIIVWFGDAPGHDPVCAAISGEAADVTEASATAELQAAPAIVVAVSTTTGPAAALDDDPVAGANDYGACGAPGGIAGQATRITAATGAAHDRDRRRCDRRDAGGMIQAAVTSTGNVRLVPSPEIRRVRRVPQPAHRVRATAGRRRAPTALRHRLGRDAQVPRGGADRPRHDRRRRRRRRRRAEVGTHHRARLPLPPLDRDAVRNEAPEDPGRCETVVPGRYATAVTIYNPPPAP